MIANPQAISGTIWTIGHSNRAIDDFVRLLHASKISLVADVRRFPGSLRHPQYGREILAETLSAESISYRHFPGLGGRRGKRQPDSPNSGWRVAAFNAFADHMNSAAFQSDLKELMILAASDQVALLCSEAVPWRCHRRLIADALIVRGWTVLDIIGAGPSRPHELTAFAQVVNDRIVYPGDHPK
jgi:uncharacterized protein (DUF488 family)